MSRRVLHRGCSYAHMSADGWGLGEHGMFCKMANYELQTWVPMAIRVPWMPAAMGRSTRGMAELVDMYPTLADLAGVSTGHEALEGVSLRPLFSDPELKSTPWKNASFSQYPVLILPRSATVCPPWRSSWLAEVHEQLHGQASAVPSDRGPVHLRAFQRVHSYVRGVLASANFRC